MLSTNLLPPHEQALLRREAWLRATFAVAGSLAAAAVIGIVLLVPSFVAVRLQANEISRSKALEDQQSERQGLTAKENALKATARAADRILAAESQKVTPDVLVLSLFRGLPTDLEISRVEVHITPRTIVLTGTAPTRNSFLALKDTLSANTAIGKVNYPVAYLIRDRDIAFTLTLPIK